MAAALPSSIRAQANKQIDLLIADDSPMNCQLLKGVFARSRSSFRVVACAVSLAEVVAAMNTRDVDIALINESLQDGPLSGFRVLDELRRAFRKTLIIMLLKSATDDLVVDAFRAGARGVFCRAEALDLLYKCVSSVYGGQIWANSSQLRAVIDAFAGAAPLRLINSQGKALLTKRESDVVRFVVEGHTNREAADKLGLTEHTVSNYLFRIYEKLGISSRVELVLYSIKSLGRHSNAQEH
jgi:DNA-binding NarL/FixJ family response regulator